jgi:hypothetical protein
VVGGSTPPAPDGSNLVNFYLCGPSTTAITSCSTASGTLKNSVSTSTATKVGNNYTVLSGDITVTSAGYYCFTATWAGDDNYHPIAPATVFQDDGTNECLQITPVTPALHTQVSNAGPITPGTTVHDTMTFDTAPATPSNGVFGTITFKVYGPFPTSTPTCTGTATTSTATVVSGTLSYNSADFSPSDPGFYNWTAEYAPGTGDVNNVAVAASCGADNEQIQVQQFNPSLTTAQTVTIKDSATITVSGGGPLAGSAHFQPFSDSSCTAGNELAAVQDVPVAGASPQTVSTTPMTITTTTPVIYWKVSYTSTNNSQTGIAATCTENASITINN